MDDGKSEDPQVGIRDKLEKAMRNTTPIEALKRYALELSFSGLKKKQIYDLFLEYSVVLQESDRADDQAILEDVMDMISDSFSRDNPNNMNLPA